MVVSYARSELGVVYTPRDVCEPMVRKALEGLEISERTRVCDPAVGEGAFVVEIVRVLSEKIGRAAAARCVVGADVDPRAVEATRAAVERFVGARVPELRDNIRTGDALAVDWPRVDAVVGNPPYVRQERLGARKGALRDWASYDGVADLYVYFVELAHRILRPGGRYCLITPNKWLTAAYAGALRAFLDEQHSVEGLVDFTVPLFRDADAFPCIVWGTLGGTAEPLAHRSADSVAAALATRGHPLRNWHVEEPRDAELIAKLSRWPKLGEVVAPPSRGIITGCNRAFVIDAETRARLIDSEPAAAELIRPYAKGRDIRRWRTAPIERYVLLVDRGTSLAKLPRVRAHLARFRDALEPGSGRKPGTYKWFELQDPVVPLAKSRAPRLLYQDIQTQPMCSLDETGELVPDTTVWILPSSDLVLLAILNSPLYHWYARRRFPPALNGAVRPKLEYTRALPIAQPAKRLRAKIESLVRAQLRTPAAARDAELASLVCDAYELKASERPPSSSSASRPRARR